MNKKQKTMLYRIIIAAVLVAAVTVIEKILELNVWIAAVHYMVPYFVIGYDILKKAWKGILKRQVFDENFLMAVATVGAIALGEFREGVAVMLYYQIGERSSRKEQKEHCGTYGHQTGLCEYCC